MHSAAKQKVEKLQKRLNRAEADLTELSEVMDAQQRQTLIIAESVQSMRRGILGYPHKTKIKVSINFDKQKWLLIFYLQLAETLRLACSVSKRNMNVASGTAASLCSMLAALTLPMVGRGYSTHLVCVCVCVCVLLL